VLQCPGTQSVRNDDVSDHWQHQMNKYEKQQNEITLGSKQGLKEAAERLTSNVELGPIGCIRLDPLAIFRRRSFDGDDGIS
jgi:hypothetical protein